MTTTMNTGAASLSDEQLDDILNEHWNYQGVPRVSHIIDAMRAAISVALSIATPQADAAPSLPRYTEWLHLRTYGQWSDGVPEWARDHDGRMNDVTAANAVIEELADAAIAAGGAQEAECTCAAKDMPFGRCCKAPPILAAEHREMRVDYSGMFKQAISALKHGAKEPGIAEMLRQLKDHMTELGQRWYAGDAAVVDELLQLYCVERDARTALSAPAASNGAPK